MGTEWAGVAVDTLTLGSVYALVAVGFVVLFRATKVLSFAQGAFMVIGALVFKSLLDAGWSLLPALFGGLITSFVVGAATYWIVFARIVGTEPFVTAMATIGLSTLYVAIAIMIWGATQITLPASTISSNNVNIGPFALSPAGIFALVLAGTWFVLMFVGLSRTRLGLRMRAVADDARLAGQMGINIVRVSMISWGLAAAAAGTAAIAYLLSSVPDPSELQNLGLLAFPAILLGGLDSIGGALVGGVVIAFIQSLVGTFWNGNIQDVAAYGVLLTVLFVRPNGIFGRPEASRL